MGRHPIEEDADALLVQMVNEIHEVLRRSVATGRRKEAGGLIAPRAEERVLGDGHQFDVGETGPFDVIGQAGRNFAVRERTPVLLRHAHPRTQVYLVDGHRGGETLELATGLHPATVAPAIVLRPNDRAGARRDLVEGAERVGFVLFVRVEARGDVKLITSALADSGDETLPNS